MPLPNLAFNPYVSPFTPGLGNVFTENLAHRQQAYEANADFADALSYNNDKLKQDIGPFASDYRQADEIFNKTRKKVEGWAEKADYENMGREISKGAREFSREIGPLMENRKRHDEYENVMQQAFASGHISKDTYDRSRAASVEKYKGYDREKGAESLFRGFIPSKDVNLIDKADKLMANWKENGSYRFDRNKDGSYETIRWEDVTADDVRAAIKSAFRGDNDVMGYTETQNFIGNKDRVEGEKKEAEDYAANKYAYRKEIGDLGFPPGYGTAKKEIPFYQEPPTSYSGETPNRNAISKIQSNNIEVDDLTNKAYLGRKYEIDEDGNWWKFANPQGKQIGKLEFHGAGVYVPNEWGGESYTPADQLGYTRTMIPKEEVKNLEGEAQAIVDGMNRNRFLQEEFAKKPSDQELNDPNKRKEWEDKLAILNDPEKREEWIDKNAKFDSKYSKESIRRYESAMDHAKVIYGNKRFPISPIYNSASPEFTAQDANEALLNLSGQRVSIFDNALGNYKIGEGENDINAVLKRLKDAGYVYETMGKIGPSFYNENSDLPGMVYGIVVHDEDNKDDKRVMEIVAAMEDPELQPIQTIYKNAYIGEDVDVPFNTPTGKQGILRLTSSSVPLDDQGKKFKFTNFVDVLDSSGKPTGIRFTDMENFGYDFQRAFAPGAILKHMNPKHRPKLEPYAPRD